VKHPLLLLLMMMILLVEEFLLGSIKFHDLITQQAKKANKQASKQTSK
jgi:glycerol-3-phosphate acyltransferase PlsY